MIKAELLAPAGNYAKFLTALHFGADAVYMGGKSFSLRTFADNFADDELAMAVTTAHSQGKKVYITVNIYARNADFGLLEDYLKTLEKIGVDGVIVSDSGIVYFIKKVAPKLCIHLSTQANTTNKYAVKFWEEQGVSRIVLARELPLKEIAEIHEFNPSMELEAFVHGAMCISYSGRCLLSDYLDGRSSNRGACVQSCRWKYEVRALDNGKENGEWLPVEEDSKGTYIFNSKDLNMLSKLKEMEGAGICSFKIEGRMKSAYYLATVINAYKRAMQGEDFAVSSDELLRVAHRDYTEGYANGKNTQTVNYTDSQSRGDYQYIADVLDSDGTQITVEMRNRFRQGECLEVLSANDNFRKSFIVERMVDSDGAVVTDAKLVQGIYKMDCPLRLQKGDFLRRKTKGDKE